LTIRVGEQFGDLKPLNTAVLTVLDSKEEKDMPKGYFQAFSRSYPMNDHWYNVLGILKINQKLENEIRKTADELSEIISYTVQNHLMHAKNCGEGYLPVMELNEDSFSFWFPQMQLTPDEIETMTSIKEKIVNMQIVPRLLSENSNTVLSTTCAPCDQCDPTFLHTEKNEVWISNRSSRVEKKTKKDAEYKVT
jgi:hypothetical protein